MKKKKQIITIELTPKQLFINDLIAVIEKHEMIAALCEIEVQIFNKCAHRECETGVYDRMLHTLKCEL